jgi:hypothetical protein
LSRIDPSGIDPRKRGDDPQLRAVTRLHRAHVVEIQASGGAVGRRAADLRQHRGRRSGDREPASQATGGANVIICAILLQRRARGDRRGSLARATIRRYTSVAALRSARPEGEPRR